VKAIVYRRYGSPDVLQCENLETPVPGDGEVLVRVRAASVNPYDCHFLRGEPYFGRVITGLRKPKNPRLGADVAGEVERVGRNVTQFKPGDEVFGACRGAFAEYATGPERALAAKPRNMTFEQAAAVPVAALTALQALRDKGRIHAGQKVLINGAAGGVGTFAVQIAKSFGADVTGVCSTRNVEMVRSIGADHVIDYTGEDFTTKGRRYELFVDLIGNHPLSACRRVMNPRGTYVAIGAPINSWIAPLPRMLGMLVQSRFISQNLAMMVAKVSKEDLTLLCDLMESGKLTPVIDRRYPLTGVPEAVRYLEKGHARGKVVITVA
jgi:NADPH:quinone reductase-like Zn-dependent oxidoreductase